MKNWVLIGALTVGAIPGTPQTVQREFRPFTATRRDQYWTESRRYDETNVTFARAKDGSFALMFDAKAPDHTEQSPPLRSGYVFNARDVGTST